MFTALIVEEKEYYSFENLLRIYHICRRNKRNTINQLKFEVDVEKNLLNLSRELSKRRYKPSRSVCFIVKDPKLREVFAAHFRDRIIHHLLYEQYEKIWEPKFIYDSYSCRKNKGTHLAVKRLQKFMMKVTENRRANAYYLALDISGFFMNISKEILYNLVAGKLKDEFLLWLTREVIFHDCCQNYIFKDDPALWNTIPAHKTLFGRQNKTGLPIGNLTSQFYANLYMNEFDQFAKHSLKCRFYMRYVDDVLILHQSRSRLQECLIEADKFLENRLQLSLNMNKCRIVPVKGGIDFLGYMTRPQYTLVRNRVVNNLKSKLDQFEKDLIKPLGQMTMIINDESIVNKLRDTLNSYLGHFKHANSHKLKKHLFENYQFLHCFFDFSGTKIKLRLGSTKMPPFANLYSQYQHFLRSFYQHLLFFKVGCFFEFYGPQAMFMNRQFGFRFIKPRKQLGKRVGFYQKYFPFFSDRCIENNLSMVIIRETGLRLSSVMERRVEFIIRKSRKDMVY